MSAVEAVAAAARREGYTLVVTDGFRTAADQARVARRKPGLAVSAGRSYHELGLAVDVEGSAVDSGWLGGQLAVYGLSAPVAGEPWHLQLSSLPAARPS